MPPAPPAPLDPLSLPLRGSRLIEASAGTGKTYTLASLVLRLVLGHGGEAGFGRPLLPPDILVVTFTQAATEELRDRIRRRLAEAAEAFGAAVQALAEGREPPPPADTFLCDLMQNLPRDGWPQNAARLRLALAWMDEAAIHTLHGWCKRMLSEHAFDSGSLFALALDAEPERIEAEALRDWWRLHALPLAEAEARQLAAWWPGPEDLSRALRPLRVHAEALGPGLPPAQALAQAQAERDRILEALRQPWRAAEAGGAGWAEALLQALDAAVKAKQIEMRARKAWAGKLADWAARDAASAVDPGFLTPAAWTQLQAEAVRQMQAGNPHPLWPALAGLQAALLALPDARDPILAHAAGWTRQRAEAERRRRALMDFDGLLARLDAALQGPRGAALAARMRAQHPVALIDEFQDTDPVQLRIVDAVYCVAADDPSTALLMIGDPKQAIYAFRGADLPSYLQVRRQTAGRHHTLGTNYRSTPAMVAAVNTVFGQAEARPAPDPAQPPRGAFGLGAALPFHPVQAQGRRESWRRAGQAQPPALRCWTLPDHGKPRWGATEARRALAEGCAAEIAQLLDEAARGLPTGFEHDGVLRPLRPGDVAVLVNGRTEAEAVRAALDGHGVRSVFLSERSSVFEGPAAAALSRWLQAAATPDDPGVLRAALATAPLGLGWERLDTLNRDESAWDEEVLRWRALQACWRRDGVLPMLHRLMQDFGVAPRRLAADDERGLTDLMHLAELLQQAEGRLDGPAALIRWLAQQRQDARGDAEERRLRLESDADRVQVVTVHKSKGLEYPLVFLPFPAFAKPVDRKRAIAWHDAQGRLHWASAPTADQGREADAERLQEDLRKLYVALTRARHATWLGVARVKTLPRSGLGALLGLDTEGHGTDGPDEGADGPDEGPAPHAEGMAQAADRQAQPADGPAVPAEEAALQAALRPWVQGLPGRIDAVELPRPTGLRVGDQAALPQLRPAPPLPQPRPRWWIASYSALRAAEAPGPAGPDPQPPETAPASADAATFAESRQPDTAPAALPAPWGEADEAAAGSAEGAPTPSAAAPLLPPPPAGRLHAVPRGAAPGTFLHALLEWAGQRGFARLATDPALQAEARAWLAPRAARFGGPDLADTLHAWLLDWLHAPLPLGAAGGAVAPCRFAASVVEMEFWFAARQVDVAALDQAVRAGVFPGAARPALAAPALDGMLKGYIDLVFEHDGRWYVADHKSNALGEDDAAYTPQALQDAVLHHRYELQALLYLLALHRLLRQRLPGYDYERHVGGALVIFLRGHAAPGAGVLALKPPRALVDALDAAFAGQPLAPATPADPVPTAA